MAKKILIIEDDADISDLESLYLRKEGFVVIQKATGEEGLELLQTEPFDLLILDLNLPKIDGFKVLQTLRTFSKIPVIICSAREADEDIILGLSTGADDFVSKPFSLKVFAERVKANLRRFEMISVEPQNRTFFQFGNFRFYSDGFYLEKAGSPVKMASRELDVLYFLLQHAGKNLTAQEIFKEVWGCQYGDVATVAVHIQRIRKKIESKNEHFILTTYGSGYQFDASKLKA